MHGHILHRLKSRTQPPKHRPRPPFLLKSPHGQAFRIALFLCGGGAQEYEVPYPLQLQTHLFDSRSIYKTPILHISFILYLHTSFCNTNLQESKLFARFLLLHFTTLIHL